jgi:hypothetical protein
MRLFSVRNVGCTLAAVGPVITVARGVLADAG